MEAGKPAPRLPAGYTLHSFDRLASTNDEAKRLADEGAGEGVLVWAREQTAGRGRQGRLWHSPPGNLYLSILVRPVMRLDEAMQLSFVAALTVHESIVETAPTLADRLTLKWPNDILLDGKKLCGILLESGGGEPAGEPDKRWLVVGIGLNLSAAPDLPDRQAVALAAAAGERDPAVLIEIIARHWAAELAAWRGDGFARVRRRWLAHAAFLGETITATLADRQLTGTFEDLDDTGGLILVQSSGERVRIAAGEVFAAQQNG